MKLKLLSQVVAIAALSVSAAYAQDVKSNFSLNVLGTFDYPGGSGTQTRPQKINHEGEVVGIYVDSNGISYGFVRHSNGTFSPPLIDPDGDGTITEGRGNNDAGLVCGDYVGNDGDYHGFFYQNNQYETYDVSGSTFTLVLGVNNKGNFVGSYIDSSGVQHGYISIKNKVTTIDAPDAANTLTYQLTDTNLYVGYSTSSDDGLTHGFYLDESGTLHSPIDPPNSFGTIFFGLNDNRIVVGRYADQFGVTHGLLFHPPDKFYVFDYPGANSFTSLNGINKQGVVVGRYTDTSGIDHGFLAKVTYTHHAGNLKVITPVPAAARPMPKVSPDTTRLAVPQS